MRPEAEPWWRQAEADLAVARDNLGLGHWYIVSWLAQQAAEKALKAVYIERRGAQPPRMHDLPFLGEEVNVAAHVAPDLAHLDSVFGEVRYPDPVGGGASVDEVADTEAVSDLAAAERVLTWVRAQLGI